MCHPSPTPVEKERRNRSSPPCATPALPPSKRRGGTGVRGTGAVYSFLGHSSRHWGSPNPSGVRVDTSASSSDRPDLCPGPDAVTRGPPNGTEGQGGRLGHSSPPVPSLRPRPRPRTPASHSGGTLLRSSGRHPVPNGRRHRGRTRGGTSRVTHHLVPEHPSDAHHTPETSRVPSHYGVRDGGGTVRGPCGP